MTPETAQAISRRILGLLCLAGGVVASTVLLVATAVPQGLGSFGGFQAPPAFVAVVLVLFLIILLEAGRLGLKGDASWWVGEAGEARASLLIVVITAIPVLALCWQGIIWAFERLATGELTPHDETAIVGGLFVLYGAIRIPLALGWFEGHELAAALGIRSAAPDPGESTRGYNARILVGMGVGILVLDALIVLVNALVAPSDTTFYPYVKTVTPFAAFLWIVGLLGVSYLVTERIRTGLTRVTVPSAIAAFTLVPALIFDAGVPLFPMVAAVANAAGRFLSTR